jgi:peptide/nickel transport system substrate-binding protein
VNNYLKAVLAGLAIVVPLSTPAVAQTLRWS